MKAKRRHFVRLALICSCSAAAMLTEMPSVPAQGRGGDRYLKTVWTTEQGLPQNTISAIVQTHDGYLWLGTFGGLALFDGVKFTGFTPRNTEGLGGNRITVLYEDRDGALWIGLEHGGLARYRQGLFTTFTPGQGLPEGRITSLDEGRDETLWIGTSNGLVRWSAGHFTTYTTRDGLPRNEVRALCVDQQGAVWVGTDAGLARFAGGRFTTYTTRQGLPGNSIGALFETRDGQLWIGASELARFEQGRFTTIRTPQGKRINPIRSISEDQQGNLWISAPPDQGCFKRTKDGQVIHYTVRDGLSSNDVWVVLEDREGNVWLGTNGGGLNRWTEKRIRAYTTADGLPGDVTLPIIEDGEQTLWIGVPCRGLLQFRSGRFTDLTARLALQNLCIRTLLVDREGGLWVGSVDEIGRLKDGRFTRYDTAQGLPGGYAWAMYQDREGSIWVGSGGHGLGRLREGTFTGYTTADGLVNDDVRFITEDRQGALWLGTVGGLSRFTDGQFTNYTTRNGLSHNFVRAIHEDAEGTLWIGTYGGGLNRFKDGRFFHYTTANGLSDDVVSRILEDDRGHFWMSGNRGLFRVSRKELNEFADGKISSFTCVPYGIADGMVTSECNGGGQPAGWKTHDGRLWFPTIKGVVVADPHKLNAVPPPVHVERVVVDKTPMNLGQSSEAPPGSGNLEIHYTALSFVAPEKVRFRYRLEGYDPEWVDAGARRVAYYTNISPGRYRFRVRAMNNDGVWSQTDAAIEFSLAPHFYQTTWFFTLMGVGIVWLSWRGYKLRVRRLERRALVLEVKVAERTAEVVEQKNQLARANDQLTDTNSRLEQANQNMLSIFNEWRSGVMTTDEAGRITFLSRTAEQLFDLSQAEVAGHPWDEVVPLPASDIGYLKTVAQRPPQYRHKLSLRVEGSEGRPYWVEIEIKDDPHDQRRKIFFLYDVSEIYDLRQLLDEKAKFHDLVGESVAMQLVYRQIRDLAKVDTTVLIQGETGTGKELVARAIHYFSPRKSRPFIAVNCAGLTESLVASQLFGHKRGAFTGAIADHKGVFESAEGGTLFLDEIGDMPMSVQTNLLRVLQEREITRVGESSPRRIDVRVVAATHQDLDQMVADGRFRPDLLYRLRVAEIHLPPLRERRRDIPLLVAWFLGQFRASATTAAQEVSQETMQKLMSYHWPGNVRQLKSAIEAAAIRCRGPIIQPDDLPAQITGSEAERVTISDSPTDKRQRVLDALERTGGNRAAAARLLGIGRTTLYLWMNELGIHGQKKEDGS